MCMNLILFYVDFEFTHRKKCDVKYFWFLQYFSGSN